MKRIFISIFLLFGLLSFKKVQAQTSRDSETFVVKSEQGSSKKKKKDLFSSRYNKKLKNSMEEFDRLMKSNSKNKARIARKMQKPQYSDPSYFGHKRPPKKRPLGKRKMCKECGIVH